jgi:hypothetical protein
LVIALAHVYLLLPQLIQPDHQRPDPFFDQQIDDTTACRVQIGVDAAIALRRDAVQLARSETVLFGQTTLMAGAVLVVVGIEVLERASVDEEWSETGIGAGESRKLVDLKARERRRPADRPGPASQLSGRPPRPRNTIHAG